MMKPIEIFFSYAHEDEALMDEVRRQLILYDRQDIIRKNGTTERSNNDMHRSAASEFLISHPMPHAAPGNVGR
jgi:hypothetical protein